MKSKPTKKRIEAKMAMKMKLKTKIKMTTVLMVSLFLVPIIAMGATAKAAEPNHISMIDIMAKGDDLDVAGATTFIHARIVFDEVSGEAIGQVELHIKIYNELGEKVYSMKGYLKDMAVMILPEYYCHVRDVTWINTWMIMGMGMIKTTDIDMDIEYRGQIITLPNTEGKYIPMPMAMLVSPTGECTGGVWEDGGWAYVGTLTNVGGVTLLTKYMEK